MTGYVYGGEKRFEDAPGHRGARVCGDKVGTTIGHSRHKKALEQPCDRCREAYNAYHRELRAAGASEQARRLYSRAQSRAQRKLARRHAAEFKAILRAELARVHLEQEVAA